MSFHFLSPARANPSPRETLGLNRAEVMFRNGRYSRRPSLHPRMVTRPPGISEAVGPGVDSSWIGRTVSTVPGTFKLNSHGVYGEVAIVPLYGIAEYPSTLSYEQGASIWMQYLTAYGALIWLGQGREEGLCRHHRGQQQRRHSRQLRWSGLRALSASRSPAPWPRKPASSS